MQVHFPMFDNLVYNEEAIKEAVFLSQMYFGIPDIIPIKDKNAVII